MVYLNRPSYKQCIPTLYVILLCLSISYFAFVLTISIIEDNTDSEANEQQIPKVKNRMLKSVTEGGIKLKNLKTQAERNPLRAFSEDDLKEAELDMILRNNQVISECRKLTEFADIVETNSIKKALNNILSDSKHKISWCPIYKAASTIWMEHFAKLAGSFGPTEKYLLQKGVLKIGKLAKEIFNRRKISANAKYMMLQNSSKIIVVRHPFERLLSAYRDKLEKKDNKYYMKKYGYHIKAKYRAKNSTNNSTIPTFREFLEYIVKEQYFDEHWRPYHMQCNPCAVRYDYILKIETFDRDETYVVKKLNIENIIKPKMYHENIILDNHNINPNGHTDKELARLYFKDISRDLLEMVYDIYVEDFHLFGYEPDLYFNITKS